MNMAVFELEITSYSELRGFLQKGEDFFITMPQSLLPAVPSEPTNGLDLDNPVERYVFFKTVCKWKGITIVDTKEIAMGNSVYRVCFPDGYLENQYGLSDFLSLDA